MKYLLLSLVLAANTVSANETNNWCDTYASYSVTILEKRLAGAYAKDIYAMVHNDYGSSDYDEQFYKVVNLTFKIGHKSIDGWEGRRIQEFKSQQFIYCQLQYTH